MRCKHIEMKYVLREKKKTKWHQTPRKEEKKTWKLLKSKATYGYKEKMELRR